MYNLGLSLDTVDTVDMEVGPVVGTEVVRRMRDMEPSAVKGIVFQPFLLANCQSFLSTLYPCTLHID